MKIKKILVAGYFDRLHPGHVIFLKKAAKYGNLYVSIGSDENLVKTKNRTPIFNESERKYLLDNLNCVYDTEVSAGINGALSFATYFHKIKPDIFIINEDGHNKEKENFIRQNNCKYFVLERDIPLTGINKHSTTNLIKKENVVPHRLDLVGFFDQIKLNRIVKGSVVLANINGLELEDRSGMSSSTRNLIIKVFGEIPTHLKKDEFARYVFALENPPNRKYVSGVVDQIGITYPGVNKLSFDNSYWPNEIKSINNNKLNNLLSENLYLVHLGKRPDTYEVFDGKESFEKNNLLKLNYLADKCWQILIDNNIKQLGKILTEAHFICKEMIPGYESIEIAEKIKYYQNKHYGGKLMGAGGYGYMLVASNKPESNFIKISIRTN